MSGIFDALTKAARFQAILLSWFVPTLLPVLAYSIVIGPELRGSWLAKQFQTATARLELNRSLAIVVVSALVSILMWHARDALYRLLEGYAWPSGVKEWRRRTAHVPHARYLAALRTYLEAKEAAAGLDRELADARKADDSDAIAELERELANAKSRVCEWKRVAEKRDRQRLDRGRTKGILKHLPRRRRPLLVNRDRGLDAHRDELLPYPATIASIAATSFGNGMSAMESYGVETYGLDSQNLWYELLDVSSDSMRSALESARERTDAMVALWYATVAFLLGALGALIWITRTDRAASVVTVAAIAAIAFLKLIRRVLLQALHNWSFAMRGLVNQGRHALADKHGLELPGGHAAEREMWQALHSVIEYGDRAHDSILTLQKFRRRTTVASTPDYINVSADGTLGVKPFTIRIVGERK